MFIKPMKCKKDNHEGIPAGGYIYETKWDGIRCCIVWDRRDGVTIYSKSGADITRKFPELIDRETINDIITCNRATFDGEIVCFKNGVPDFSAITSRLHLGSSAGWKQGAIDNPATACIFDVTEVEGEPVVNNNLHMRKRLLNGTLIGEKPYLISQVYRDGEKLYAREKARGAEGIVAKRATSIYQPGRRLRDWLKIKIMYKAEVVVYGFTAGLGKRDQQFGALLFRGLDGRPGGKVGTGFTDAELIEMTEFLETREPVFQIDGRATETFLLDKPFHAIVKGMKKNKSGAIRESVFVQTLMYEEE